MYQLLPLLLVVLPVFAQNESSQTTAKLPVVDLGYTMHQATFNLTGNYYNFSNIRYAEPPLGKLRFAAPVPPKGRNRTIENGAVARICPQAYPLAVFTNQIYNSYYSMTGQTSLDGFDNATVGFDYPRNTPLDPRATEDCLFLDVMVPRKVFEKRTSGGEKRGKGAPVMVWIHGGGYGAGTKYDVPPAGLLSRSQLDSADGVIYVAINYRLGALGWSSGPSFSTSGLPNAGFHDQRLALNWVKKNIHLFGGDPNRVTAFGESAGGGSIAFQITAYGGEKGRAPFQQAILQSPGFVPPVGKFEAEANFKAFLGALNVSSLDEARQIDSKTLLAVNELQVRNSRTGSWTYGPVVDGTFVPELPSLLFLHNRFDRSVNVMVGHNGDEGVGYPGLTSDAAFDAYVDLMFSDAPVSARKYITEVLYPPILESTRDLFQDYNPATSTSLVVTGYNNTHGRQNLLTSETVINCLTTQVSNAFRGRSYAYLFATPPALHGQELYYVFYNEQATDVFYRPINVTLAHIMQDYWLNFARTGTPNGKGVPTFAPYGSGKSVQSLSLAGVGATQDVSDNERCRWWQLGLYM
ncbi:Alpha/Beta hydrolase protein [Boeremia exigua]|uniref:Alpha/Beta hydrolase protein n=1 Tax=Boeremia exigua TaxID=749465 RepID=UPI001E8DF6C3|nr:Alpha/Beta hydrolase protein [Boeremia exigua]KAH6639108.1 Alpha/Beta hydrolase protein [Boeremia exigua]